MSESAFGWLLTQGGASPPPASGADAASTNVAVRDATAMTLALEEARRGVGRTAPNPAVGAVVVKDGAVLATGFHPRAGERHAEVVALDAVAGQARGATMYVTLEPCVHHGRTPPCVDRILAEGIARVVVGVGDPNPRVNGGGIAALRTAGVRVDFVEDEALRRQSAALLLPFTSAMTRQRPWVILKVASTLDGRVAAHNGSSRWITGAAARTLVHELRDAVDAVMVGSSTAIADDPALTVRDATGRADGSARRDPRRIVVDSRLRCDPKARVFGERSLALHAPSAAAERTRAFDDAGVARLSTGAARVDLRAALSELCARGVHSLMVEGGPGLATALWQAGLVDELWWFTAPRLLGGDGLSALGPLGLASPDDARRLAVVGQRAFGDGDLVRVLMA